MSISILNDAQLPIEFYDVFMKRESGTSTIESFVNPEKMTRISMHTQQTISRSSSFLNKFELEEHFRR
ncbi:unnamed protein product, partial [Mesorhabditis belari]|uniref:Uncharacterized protein n=1 Tax=Mesorhabditis belari TaxID=2138241 RepID=A0AAF3ETS3_9BILA